MVLHSAALLAYRFEGGAAQVFLGHMGGPFWSHKDAGAWSIPKGVYEPGAEDPAVAARREFAEEVGVPWEGPLEFLGEFRQPSGKVLAVFVGEAVSPLEFVASNEFELEWPRGSGQVRSFPEVDRAQWFALPEAREKVARGQVPVLDALEAWLEHRPD
ncbi:MAG: NUDIX domain-containing protein [Actinomycetota bacterium]